MDATDHGAEFTGWVSELARAHTRALAGIARAQGLTHEDALDTMQEALTTFLLLPQARKLVGHEEDSRAFLGVIVRNAARNLRRRHHLARPHASVDDETMRDLAPTVDELIAQAEEHVRLLGCVNRLTAIQSKVVTLRMLDEASAAAVATALDLQPGHVAVLLHRAKKELLDCMLE